MALWWVVSVAIASLSAVSGSSMDDVSCKTSVQSGTCLPTWLDYSVRNDVNATACCALCDANATGCVGWTLRGTLCHLKSEAVGDAVKGPCTSGRRHKGGVPNIVWLIDESTDGRTYRAGSPVPLPNIRKLMNRGVTFDNHYSNSPVCCPSRSSMWSGRHVHHIPHEHNGLRVNGAWNNYEGLPDNYTDRIGDVLGRNGYSVKITGKTDWSTGGHALFNWIQFWTMYTRFPYNITDDGGWNTQQDMCAEEGTVSKGNTSHGADWAVVEDTTQWIKDVGAKQQPFFAYSGLNIVHPPYCTTQNWFDTIPEENVTLPSWPELNTLHPCDLQSSMLKGCTKPAGDSGFYASSRRRRIRRVYYAMINEFDAMVGRYVKAVEDAGLIDNTVFIITSDHGDMNMEHQQYYKMVAYDASSRVPLVISGPGVQHSLYTGPTSGVDIFPTIMDLAHINTKQYSLDGTSLLPILMNGSDPHRPDFVVSQGHMANLAMSWYLVKRGDWKYITYGTGHEVPPQLFHVGVDPDETTDLIHQAPSVAHALDQLLRTVVNYPHVSRDVAAYNRDMFQWWRNYTTKGNTTHDFWQQLEDKGPWSKQEWSKYPGAARKAVEAWLAVDPPKVLPCRSNLTWPPLKA